MNLENQISAFISNVPCGCIFDAHAVIAHLLEKYPDDYLGFHTSEESMSSFHGKISREIEKITGGKRIERLIENCYSKNIKGNFSVNSCWKKVR